MRSSSSSLKQCVQTKLKKEQVLASEIALGRKDISETVNLNFITHGLQSELVSALDNYTDVLTDNLLNRYIFDITSEVKELFII